MLRVIKKPTLPKEIFHVEAKPELLAQSVRVYLANRRQGTQSALTRADVNRTGKKLYRQKHTGGARHGDRKAPIFVGGGVAFAPKPRDYSLKLPDTMRKKALHAALSLKAKDKKILVVSGMAKISGKTKEIAQFLDKLDAEAQSWLIITAAPAKNIFRAARNIASVTILPANQLNTYQVLKAERILLMEEALDSLGRQSKPKVKVVRKTTRKVTKKVAKKVSKTKK